MVEIQVGQELELDKYGETGKGGRSRSFFSPVCSALPPSPRLDRGQVTGSRRSGQGTGGRGEGQDTPERKTRGRRTAGLGGEGGP